MSVTPRPLVEHLIGRIVQVRRNLGLETHQAIAPAALLDSMGLVELLGLLADDCGTSPSALEDCAERRFGTVAELAEAMSRAGFRILSAAAHRAGPGSNPEVAKATVKQESSSAWLSGFTARLPAGVQRAAELDALLHRPAGWFEQRAGIRSRHVWNEDDPLAAAAECAREALERCGVPHEEVGALLVTAEAPPMLAGLAADLHHRLNLSPRTVALETGGACTAFLAALWVGRALLPQGGIVAIVAVEAPSRYLEVRPGLAGEAAALFGDGVAAALVAREPLSAAAVPLLDLTLACQGDETHSIRVEHSVEAGVEVYLDGRSLASRAVRAMTQAVRDLARENDLEIASLEGIVVHGGNGRMPALVARQLDLPLDRVWSRTAETGNLGSASLPAAWAELTVLPRAPVAWAAAGAGIIIGAALTGPARKK
jgi:3-oxoacyl-[acyl-carrier-protein] synthase III